MMHRLIGETRSGRANGRTDLVGSLSRRAMLFGLGLCGAASCLAGPDRAAAADPPNPPPLVTRESYRAWLTAINSSVSPYFDRVFDWYEQQASAQFPPEVATAPDHLWIDVGHALAQGIATEDAGDVEEGTTVGSDAYFVVDAPIARALNTLLFFRGKPLDQPEGETRPPNSLFGSSVCTIKEKWGPGNYLVSDVETNGGFVSDLNDLYTILVRGSEAGGYALFESFLSPIPDKDTRTTFRIWITLMKSVSGAKTEIRQSLRQNGQNYKPFAGSLDSARKQYGFNEARFRKVEKLWIDSMRQG